MVAFVDLPLLIHRRVRGNNFLRGHVNLSIRTRSKVLDKGHSHAWYFV
jgi:hypothetical protein